MKMTFRSPFLPRHNRCKEMSLSVKRKWLTKKRNWLCVVCTGVTWDVRSPCCRRLWHCPIRCPWSCWIASAHWKDGGRIGLGTNPTKHR
ncbi:unnamed protein product [Cyprideis torosa]|uniref:Uncharacterized protein n=1 Tax=Cyprideis torosa TaxID=163714 RepID=A0A7R8ZXS5_9CRUS|nr:unnamed protein product [Cyprideis torosa]CAG0910629.1 unnamed protein product [Cyprideis torosa]